MNVFRFFAFIFVICTAVTIAAALIWTDEQERHAAELSAKQSIIDKKDDEITQLKNQLGQCVNDVNNERLKCDVLGYQNKYSVESLQ